METIAIGILSGLVITLAGGLVINGRHGGIKDLKPIVLRNQEIVQTEIPVIKRDIEYIKAAIDEIKGLIKRR